MVKLPVKVSKNAKIVNLVSKIGHWVSKIGHRVSKIGHWVSAGPEGLVRALGEKFIKLPMKMHGAV